MAKIIAINAGSSSLKFKLFEMEGEKVLAQGLFDRIGISNGTIKIKYGEKEYRKEAELKDHAVAVKRLLQLLLKLGIVQDFAEIVGVGHRVVAGGEYFKKSVAVNSRIIRRINELTEYAPIHNPANLMGIEAFRKILPNAVSVAVFDTSFHQTMPKENYVYSVPYEWYHKYGARRYGAHGTSHRYVVQVAAHMMEKPLKQLKLISCHLGAGASLCAVKNGKSFDTSMGFTPLTGITMATRSGDVDVSLISFMMQKLDMHSMPEVIYDLNKKSGLLGISGISSDMRDIEAKCKTDERAQLAIDIFVKDVVKYVGAYMAEMGGLDGIIFTAGIGENSGYIREKIMKRLEFLGIEVDEKANAKRGVAEFISTPTSRVAALMIPTNEELMIARDVKTIIEAKIEKEKLAPVVIKSHSN
ncbi:acetate/propionate family kinase [Liquorilactobacillus satsumensis]|uniref:acetate/propionate family kinase n=1 Tax=Liquorilactobacillus satsumensis TaxID=259059 RepID=UPI001E3534E3|nr:acetate kinase [Liquorilactobacillus satsumensis]MCC7666689.1 acetate kinase [Liquorilactobacillus satsumensis]MCP9312691.1 acetate kinase [Liquorilactobacillus satsumensis]MCP9357566.1 acetate kinase [Liquorilactobacillus satsumensis]MCP9359877.1 acetate kinase [Liquorilactobacillus satsumensis]MCP9371860.1 acetate kinase [Liquorilactobacillus satsumensis]